MDQKGGNLDQNTRIKFLTILLYAVVLFGIGAFVWRKTNEEPRACSSMNLYYTETSSSKYLRNIDFNNANYKDGVLEGKSVGKLRDYYIKSAYNCCVVKSNKSGFVSLCALKRCLQECCRFLDFEIYSIDDEPVIAVSSVNSFNFKQSFNYIKFKDAISTISQFGFNSTGDGGNPCNHDPLFLHLRIKTYNKKIYDKIANYIYSGFKSSNQYSILGKEYSYEWATNDGKNFRNFSDVKLEDLKKKICIIVDSSVSKEYMGTKLEEYINMTSGSPVCKSERFDQVKFTPNMQDLQNYNMRSTTIVMPNLSPNAENYSWGIAKEMGCQFITMCFQVTDNNLREYNDMFNGTGHAFVLKPKHLRNTYVEIKDTASRPELNLASKPRKMGQGGRTVNF